MSLPSAIHAAIAALLVNKGRSFLTSLGILIGIGSVVAMVAAGEGAQSKLADRLQTIGTNLVVVRPEARTPQGLISEGATLTVADADAIRQTLGPLVIGVAPSQLTLRLVVHGPRHGETLIAGSLPEVQRVRNWPTVHGSFFSDADLKRAAPVCVIGPTVRRRLFPDTDDPVGKSIRVASANLRVIGLLADKGLSPTGADQDDIVFVPLTTVQRRIVTEERISLILVAARSPELLPRVKDEIIRILRERHHMGRGTETFDVTTVQEMAQTAQLFLRTLQLLIAVIASVSLVVGGIGIMNIMLVSVTERTREIGIRMAVGAAPGQVLVQFLIEAMLLSFAGGLLGVVLGLTIASILAAVIPWPLIISPALVLTSFLISTAVGVFFGYYPAWRASRLEPIQALLHYE